MAFSKVDKNDAIVLREILGQYSIWSGQKVNMDKSGFILSKCTLKGC